MTTHLRVVPAPPRHRTPTQRAWGLIWHASHRIRLTAGLAGLTGPFQERDGGRRE